MILIVGELFGNAHAADPRHLEGDASGGNRAGALLELDAATARELDKATAWLHAPAVLKTDGDFSDATLAILAGGQGERMGFAKGNLRIAGQPILVYLLQRFAWPGPKLLVTAPGVEHPPGFDRFDAEAVDPIAGEGPLRGMLTALQQMQTARLVVTTVDMPGIGREQLEWPLRQLGEHPDRLGWMMSRMIDGREQIEPFPFACRAGAANLIEKRLGKGRRSVHSLSQLSEFAAEPAPVQWPVSVWANLNHPRDYDLFVTRL